MLSIVVPAFNEARRLPATLERLVAHCAREESGRGYEIMLVDDGSRDATSAVAEEWSDRHVRLLRHDVNRGKGAAVRTGVRETSGDEVLLTDADLSTPIEDIGALRRAMSEGADVAIGSRGLSASRITLRQPFYRERMGKTFNVLVRAALGWSIRDTQCGFKLFRGDAARAIFAEVRETGFGFDVEVIHIALHNGLRVREVPVRWHNSPDSRVHIVRSSAAMLGSLARIVVRDARGAYGPKST
jgi:dolichyl-phosphate beta-glucosyltransferase